ncbi:MAG: hypothetical protein IPK33_05885 [Gemmatimonadetes bacterium]|nr:hypothetical protein [Gemmatimonadota bacterium]
MTNGVTEDEIKLAQKLGFVGYLNYHLAFTKIDDVYAQNFARVGLSVFGAERRPAVQRRPGDAAVPADGIDPCIAPPFQTAAVLSAWSSS